MCTTCRLHALVPLNVMSTRGWLLKVFLTVIEPEEEVFRQGVGCHYWSLHLLPVAQWSIPNYYTKQRIKNMYWQWIRYTLPNFHHTKKKRTQNQNFQWLGKIMSILWWWDINFTHHIPQQFVIITVEQTVTNINLIQF